MKKGVYKESGWIAEVEILEDNSDEDWEKYKLKVVKTIRESRMFGKQPDGHVFDVSAKLEYRHYVDWELTETK